METIFLLMWIGGLSLVLGVFVLWIWALIDILRSEFKDIAIKIGWFLFVFFVQVVGLIVYLIAGKATKMESTECSAQKYDNLERIKKLYDDGVLSEAEFESEKKKIMEREGR